MYTQRFNEAATQVLGDQVFGGELYGPILVTHVSTAK